jgi:cyclic-di-GMP-binding protein
VRSLIEYMRAHRAAAPGLWAALHASLTDAEARGFAYTRAPDPLNPWRAQSAAEAHSVALLIDLSSPFGRSPREFEQIWYCARHFAPYCRLLPEDGHGDDDRPSAYGLDPQSDCGLRPIAIMSGLEGIRRFDSTELSERFREVTTRIRQRRSVADLDLDPSVGVEEAVRLLLTLYRPWARGSGGRRFTRRPGKGQVELTGDWKAIGFYVSGKPFRQPGIFGAAGSIDNDMRLLTFGERVANVAREEDSPAQRAAEQRGYFCTQWEILDESLGGFRLRRRSSADRLEHRELIAIRPHDMRNYLLGTVSWVMYREDGSLEAGIKLLEGMPTAIAVRSVGAGKNQHDLTFQQAFQLAATPAINSPATLVLPAGYFQPFRAIEVFDDKLNSYHLLELVNRGANFDQATFEPVVNVAS